MMTTLDNYYPSSSFNETTSITATMSHRLLEESQPEEEEPALWEMIYTGVVLLGMFAALLMDRLGADSVMMAALTLYMIAGVITVQEGIAGFSNEGILTVIVLFVVAEGISKTGALDWYLGKLLGHPKTAAEAQLRLMIPIGIVSAFLNNTPIVVVMIPIVQKWSKAIKVPIQQLLIPLSFATILGGTCSLIGTSTNLVVDGLLQTRYGDTYEIGLFDVGLFGVPIAIIGVAYMLLFSTLLLPGAESQTKTLFDQDDDILLGARVTQWSPAAGRTVQRSGLRDTGGIYLVSVVRATTGHVHRAVSRDFVVQKSDVCYFTGFIESFGDFCEKHGLEMLTNEVEGTDVGESLLGDDATKLPGSVNEDIHAESEDADCSNIMSSNTVAKGWMPDTNESLTNADEEEERRRRISRFEDIIRGVAPATEDEESLLRKPVPAHSDTDGSQVVVAFDKDVITIGVAAPDRAGLMSDIAKALLELNLNVRHNEATVVVDQSISVWRCTSQGAFGKSVSDLEEIWTVLSATLAGDGDIQSAKKRGIQVVRARVTDSSSLLNKSAKDVDFRRAYGAAIVAIQNKDGCATSNLSSVSFEAGDILILQVSDDSVMLERPPEGFYETKKPVRKSILSRVISSNAVENGLEARNDEGADVEYASASKEDVWKDLQVQFRDSEDKANSNAREFLTALEVKSGSSHIGKNVRQIGILKLPELTLVSIERPQLGDGEIRTELKTSIDIDEPLKEGDILWYAGPVAAIADLRKVPGLKSYENEDIMKMKEHVHDRRLVQAVISRNGPLVGKTVKEAHFRTTYGAAVIAIQRGNTRVMDHPGNVKLSAGDVLLLEAGPTFMSSGMHNNPAFSLLSEVKDSAPPRLRLLIPALLIAVAMLVVYMVGWVSLLVSALAAAMVMVAVGCLSEQEARESINWEIFVTIAAAFGIGTAMVNSGLATLIANQLVKLGTSLGIGDAGLLGAVYFATFLISNIVTNNAAAALMFPIAMDAADSAGTNRVLMAFTLMYGASASFMTPFGYQTNLLVYGPGGYKTKDFLVFGTPLQIVLWIATTAIMTVIRPWYISWIGSTIILVIAIIIRVIPLKKLFGKEPKKGHSASVKET